MLHGDALAYELLAAPAGMTIQAASGVVSWTPWFAQLGTQPVLIRITDGLGGYATQTFSVGVGTVPSGNQPTPNAAPVFVSPTVLGAVAGGLYVYAANAVDPDFSGTLAYQLATAPPGMVVDPSSGVVQWIADAPGSYQVVLQVTDNQGGVAQQAFGISVEADAQGPVLTLSASPTRVSPGEVTQVSVSALDDVGVASVALSIDGVAWPLDANLQTSWLSQQPGPHLVVVTATDVNGQTSRAELLLAVTQPGDLLAPEVSFAADVAEAVITERLDIVGSVADERLLRYTLSLQREGTTQWTQLYQGTTPVTNGVVGTVDATKLINGIYQLKLFAEDVNGQVSEFIRPVRIDGGAKVGIVQLSFADVQVPMQGMPVSVVRAYDSRRSAERGDFGYGWSLDVHQGSVQHNRPVGSYYALYTGDVGISGFELPCQRINEQRPHITEVRISEREWYTFRPRLTNTYPVSGGCTAELYYEAVDGSTAGADLLIIGNSTVRADKHVRLAADFLYDWYPMNLLDAYTLEPYNPTSFQLLLADGRLFDLTLDQGILRVADRNDNWLFVEDGRIAHSGA